MLMATMNMMTQNDADGKDVYLEEHMIAADNIIENKKGTDCTEKEKEKAQIVARRAKQTKEMNNVVMECYFGRQNTN